MPNIVSPGTNDTMAVACVILCCDKKRYTVKKKPSYPTPCMRLGSKKHECVKKNVKAMKKRKIKAEKRFYKSRLLKTMKNKSRLKKILAVIKVWLSPDTITRSRLSIDAKFPCDDNKLKANLGKRRVTRSTGPGLMGDKEDAYGALPGVRRSVAMSPDDAAEQTKKNNVKCNCKALK
jgi:hypothetical protein